ncbi:MAG: insulinase family protein [Pseudomonadota bacterium]|nr:insulinase family protein [Pseudomonadota bacterium]
MNRPFLTGTAFRGMLALALALSFAFARCSAIAATGPTQSEDVLRATLANGLRVVIIRDTLAPTVATQLTYLAGGYETPKGFPGTAHALEHMMFRGSEDLSGPQLNEITGKMGADSNAFTTEDATQFRFTAPSTYLDLLLRIEASRMRGALLTERDWSAEKGAIEQEVSGDISDPDFLAFEEAESILFKGTGYAEDPLGTRPSFDRTTARSLRRFYGTWYQPGNAILVIVGDVDPRVTLAKVEHLFEPIPSRAVPKRKPVVVSPVSPRTLMRTTPASTGSVEFVYRFPGMKAADYPASKILVDVLNNARSSLSELAAKGRVLSADAQIDAFSQGAIGVVEAGFAKGGDAASPRRDLEQVLAATLHGGVPDELVEAAKRAERERFELSKNSAESLAGEWSRALAWQGSESPEIAEQALQRVSVDDVNRVARRYLRPRSRVTIVMTPSASGARPPNSAGFGGSESFGGDKKLDVPLPAWASDALRTLEMPKWTLAPATLKLANGLTLIVQPEHISRTVTVVGHVDHNTGLQEPKGQEGVAHLLDALFDYGTVKLDRSAFHGALDAIAANESAGHDFELVVPTDAFDRGVELLADNELRPALPASAFNVQRQVLARTLAGELESPTYKVRRALRVGLLPPGDSQLREATPATVGALSLEDVDAYFHAALRPDLTTIVVVGDVSTEQAKATIERYFGAWSAHGPKPDVVPPPVPPNTRTHAFVRNAYASQAKVVMGEMLELDLHNRDRYALQLGNDVLGGNGFASRLMADIRVAHGYAYGVASGFDIERSRAIFFAEYGADADRIATVDALMLAEFERMQRVPIADDELANARQFEIRSIPLEVASVSRIAHALLTWSYKGEPLNQPIVAGEHYLRLSAAEIQDAFKRYVDPQRFVEVVEGQSTVDAGAASQR